MFTSFIYFLTSLVLVSSTLRGTLLDINEVTDYERDLKKSASIASVVKSSAMLSTLETALEAAGLDTMLQGPGPLTVFAPTEKAFAKLGNSTVQGLLQDTAKLSDILLYHVVRGKVLQKNLKNEVIKAANGDNLQTGVTKEPSQVLINKVARVTKADVIAKNGVIHFIDKVLLPPENLLDTMKGEVRLSIVAAALEASALKSILRDPKAVATFFAPSDEAFQVLGEKAVNELIKTPEKFMSNVLYHIATGSVLMSELKGNGSVQTIEGSSVHLNQRGKKLFINDSQVIKADILASNGVIHVIDQVLQIP